MVDILDEFLDWTRDESYRIYHGFNELRYKNIDDKFYSEETYNAEVKSLHADEAYKQVLRWVKQFRAHKKSMSDKK
jgi:hypothetical protein